MTKKIKTSKSVLKLNPSIYIIQFLCEETNIFGALFYKAKKIYISIQVQADLYAHY
jgi:hypothetical protein